jgi:Chromo (CHRromatin Organisation MOdifier) domain
LNITADELAIVFFNNWYCENGLPKNIVSDCDKLFVSRFWKALTKLTGVNLKMSTAYHPETDGSSERSNKTINQMLRYHVRRNQKGWVRALPRIHFQIMNTVNASTNFSGFQLHLGRSPRIIPPMIPSELPEDLADAHGLALTVINNLENDVAEARDNLLHAKIQQAHYASTSQSPDPGYAIGDFVMLSTFNRRREFKKAGRRRTAKLFPRWDGPYRVTTAHLEASTYTLDIRTNAFPVYHTSELKPHHANDPILFPSRTLTHPGPIVTEQGLEEFTIDKILDSRCRGHGWQFLVWWAGYAAEHDLWITTSELTKCEALDNWYQEGGDGPDNR